MQERSGESPNPQHMYRKVRGIPRQPKESTENAKGEIRYNAETEKWQSAQRGKQLSPKEERGGAAHVARHARKNKQKRLQGEKYALGELVNKNNDAARMRTLLQYGPEKRGAIGKKPDHRESAPEQQAQENNNQDMISDRPKTKES